MPLIAMLGNRIPNCNARVEGLGNAIGNPIAVAMGGVQDACLCVQKGLWAIPSL